MLNTLKEVNHSYENSAAKNLYEGPWTTVWGLTMEVGMGFVEGAKGKNWDSCNSISNRILKKKERKFYCRTLAVPLVAI